VRILTVRQPWAWAIIHGGKDVENRVRNVAGDYRGPVAIHAGLTWDGSPYDHRLIREAHVRLRDAGDGLGLIDRERQHMDPGTGHILGVVDLVGSHICKSHSGASDVPDCLDSETPFAMTCSEWAEFTPGQTTHHLVLRNPRPLTEPIPYRGALGLRTLPTEVEALILEQLPVSPPQEGNHP
jgi:hypothetical protein